MGLRLLVDIFLELLPGTEEDPYTVAEAIEVTSALAADAYSTDKVYLVGVVESITKFDSGRSSYTFLVKDPDGNQTFTVYSCKTTAEITQIYVGDTVTCYGYLQNYGGHTLEMTYQGDDNPVFVSITRGTSAITVTENENVAVTTSINSGANGTEFTFTIQVNTANYTVASVTVNGAVVTANEEGVYTSVIAGPTEITVAGYVPSEGEKTVNVNFATNFEDYAGNWGTSYTSRTITSAQLGVDASEAVFTVVLSNANHQQSTITDIPTICAKNSLQYATINLSSGTFNSVTFNLREWNSSKKFVTLTLEYTTNGTEWTATNVGIIDGTATAISAGYTTMTISDLPDGVIGVRFAYKASSSSNTQIGLEGLVLVVE